MSDDCMYTYRRHDVAVAASRFSTSTVVVGASSSMPWGILSEAGDYRGDLFDDSKPICT